MRDRPTAPPPPPPSSASPPPASSGSPPHRAAARAAVVAALVLGVCSVLLLVLVAVRWHPLLTLDGDIAAAAHRRAVRDRAVTQACRVLTDWVWDPVTMRLVCAAAAGWLVWRRAAWWTALWLASAVALATVVQQSVKAAVGRPRPVWPDPVDSAHYAAFPSGHALTATVVCGLLLWLLRRRGAGRALWRTAVTAAVVSVAGVGVTRVWLGVHWASDVLGGWLIGALLVALAVLVYERRRTRREAPAGRRG
ncbi:phosphatase PAP2 family protein [Streptomyces rubradiris]|uniref:Phosphatase PAP2 family protein n=1 Tax=Streptomyces rubradiris TaxID=285531 RepID=A0ABQ3R4J7_STRRR|nr:phosphatase PAP2 family protein [Streptomyces rubradiris]GHH06174.1 phosphatase PAP2 family protein [Streptomyces rubradiris]GHI50786.1 phosphatase PAP2 family protein [Streptomyces rubradiris]